MLSAEAERVTLDIMHDYENQQGPFEDVESSILPVEVVMEEMDFSTDRERATYLTLSTALNFMKPANQLRQRTKGLWKEEAWIYQPTTLVEDNRYEDLLDLFKGRAEYENHAVIREHGRMEYGKKDCDIWFTIATTLYEEHDSNPIHLFESFDDDAQAIFDHVQTARREEPVHDRIRLTKKYPYLGGEKIGPLWLRLINDLEVHDLHNVDLLPLPVDRQIVKVTNYLEGEDYSLEPSAQERQEIREFWEPFCKKHGYSTAELDDALWRIGEQGDDEDGNWNKWGKEYLNDPENWSESS